MFLSPTYYIMSTSDNLIHINEASFAKLLADAGNKPVLVDFWAERCGPCRMLGPVIEQLADQYAGKAIITKCDVDSNGNLAQEYDIMSIPAVKLFVNGEVVREQVGVASKDVYEKAINQVL